MFAIKLARSCIQPGYFLILKAFFALLTKYFSNTFYQNIYVKIQKTSFLIPSECIQLYRKRAIIECDIIHPQHLHKVANDQLRISIVKP